MPAFKDLTGKKFGRLTVLYRINNISGRTAWMCKCSCGKECEVIGKNLLKGTTKSCGCLQREVNIKINRKNLEGRTFGNLFVIEYSHTNGKKAYWKCLCSCGRKCIKYAHYLLNGDTKTCGKCKIKFLVNERPDLVEEWDYEKNKIDINQIGFSSNKKRWWICKKCGHSYNSTPNSRTNNNSGCPQCNESHGEKRIRLFLTKNNIIYIQEKSFKECRNVYPLEFDFYLPNHKDKGLCIEFQGKQHYEIGLYSETKEKLDNLQHRDQIKRDFCKSEGIKLLEIPYWEIKNIEKILTNELN